MVGKRKQPEEDAEDKENLKQDYASKRRHLSRTCVHEVAVPSGYNSIKDESVHGTLANPVDNGDMAKKY